MNLRQPRQALILSGIVALAIAARVFSVSLTTPPPLKFDLVSHRLPAITLHLGSVGISSPFNVIQRGFAGDPNKGYPNRETFVQSEFHDEDSGLEVVADWHPCNPHLFNGAPIDMMGGGSGCVDSSTSGGVMRLQPADGELKDSVEISWVLMGTGTGSCAVDMEKLLANGGAMLQAVETLRDNLAKECQNAPLIEARTKTEDNHVAFVDQKGTTLAVASATDAAWIRRLKAAFRDSYTTDSEEANRRVMYLLLDQILRSPQFQEEVRFALGRKT